MYTLSGSELHKKFIDGEISAVAIAETFLQRIENLDTKLEAFLTVLNERVLKKARELDTKKASGAHLGKLAGIPIAVKDNIHIKGELTTCASKILANYRAPFPATAIRLLEEEDALLIGKTNLDEFAMGSSVENSAFKQTYNPWDLTCTPGGSSGGSAAAVAARLCPIALGSDTGGSIRQPAAFCGILGFKPTYGRVSRYGLVAFASSLDQIGPFAHSMEDIARIMEVIGRHCPLDSTSAETDKHDFSSLLKQPIEGKTIGVPFHLLEGLSDELRSNFDNSLNILKKLGVRCIDISLNYVKYVVAVYYVLATAEASTNLARFDGIRYGLRSPHAKTLAEVYSLSKAEGFGAEVKRRILLGTYVLSSGYQDAYYKKAQKVRALMIDEFRNHFRNCDSIVMPVVPYPAFKLGSIPTPLELYLADKFTIPANLAGLPAISVPSGHTSEGKPLGIQFLGPQMHDPYVCQFAHAFNSVNMHSKALPKLAKT